MRTNIRPFLRFAAFFLVLALAVALANTCLIQTDTFVALMMDELKNSRDIELAVVGSSIVRDHFNAALISDGAEGVFCRRSGAFFTGRAGADPRAVSPKQPGIHRAGRRAV